MKKTSTTTAKTVKCVKTQNNRWNTVSKKQVLKRK